MKKLSFILLLMLLFSGCGYSAGANAPEETATVDPQVEKQRLRDFMKAFGEKTFKDKDFVIVDYELVQDGMRFTSDIQDTYTDKDIVLNVFYQDIYKKDGKYYLFITYPDYYNLRISDVVMQAIRSTDTMTDMIVAAHIDSINRYGFQVYAEGSGSSEYDLSVEDAEMLIATGECVDVTVYKN